MRPIAQLVEQSFRKGWLGVRYPLGRQIGSKPTGRTTRKAIICMMASQHFYTTNPPDIWRALKFSNLSFSQLLNEARTYFEQNSD